MTKTLPKNTRDEVLKRMLKTPPKPHVPLKGKAKATQDQESNPPKTRASAKKRGLSA